MACIVCIIPSCRSNHMLPPTPLAYAVTPPAALAAWRGLIFLPSLLYRTRGGGARLRRPSRERTLSRESAKDDPKFSGDLIMMTGKPCVRVEWNANIPNNLAVNGARDAVLKLQVHLGHSVLWENGGVRDITCNANPTNQPCSLLRFPNASPVAIVHVSTLIATKISLRKRTNPA